MTTYFPVCQTLLRLIFFLSMKLCRKAQYQEEYMQFVSFHCRIHLAMY
ncbi:hypothetical protein PORCAN_1625 [Porphyromonas crevioricanis JCM 13913]|nr:hypothetical protein PORCAN_1625 [Porphyromonas crevioricanis JCM 13913]